MQEFAPCERAVIILGSTGSIGTQALDVISRHRGSYRVVGLGAGEPTSNFLQIRRSPLTCRFLPLPTRTPRYL